MRATAACLLVLLVPGLAAAQVAASSTVVVNSAVGVGLPTITSPLAPIGLPLPSPAIDGRDPWVTNPPRDPWITRAPRDPWITTPRADAMAEPAPRVLAPVYLLPQFYAMTQTVYIPPPTVTVVVVPAEPREERRPAPEPSAAERADAAPAAVAPVRPSTFYFIPGCYMGNVPPDRMTLPPGCDRGRLVTHTPQ